MSSWYLTWTVFRWTCPWRSSQDPIEIFPLNEYDHVILNISAGADSMGCLFELIKQGLIYLNWSSGTNVLMDMEISTGNFGTGLVRNRILKV